LIALFEGKIFGLRERNSAREVEKLKDMTVSVSEWPVEDNKMQNTPGDEKRLRAKNATLHYSRQGNLMVTSDVGKVTQYCGTRSNGVDR
jgi:hypothetical protein